MKKILWLLLCIISSQSFAQVQKVLVLNPALKPFYHGLASGDPLADRVIIWTRVTPDSSWTGPANVDWRVATDTNMTNVVQSGTFTTSQLRDYTVKVDVTGLQPNTFYYYDFTYAGCTSVKGRTKTAPLGMADSLRFAVVSCANYEAGYFNVYKVIKERNDIDAVIHLGDYIYEYEHDGYAFNATSNRIWEPNNEITTLNDYRTRYSTYHLDADLMKLHQQFPFFMIWDDHEWANDAYKDGAQNHTEGTEGAWIDRKSFAKKAYFEWVPIRERVEATDTVIFRKIEYGDLVDFLMLDTRIYGRDEQVGATSSAVNDTNRTILGAVQFNWLRQNLLTSSKQWKILSQQVMVAPLQIFGVPVNADQWDGYASDRSKLINFIMSNNIENVAVITGDIHCSWANDIPTASYNSSTGAGSAFVEFVTTSVTSPGLPIPVGASVIQALNSHVKYVDLTKKGFVLLDINQQRTQSDWYYVNTIDNSDGGYTFGDSWYVNDGERFLRHSGSPSVPRAGVVQPQTNALPVPCDGVSIEQEQGHISVTSVYPNPADALVYVQLYVLTGGELTMQIADVNGRVMQTMQLTQVHNGLNNIVLDVSTYAAGVYYLTTTSYGHAKTIKLVVQ